MFSDWLLEKLREWDWSQADLARATGITRAAISKYMAGRIPDDPSLRKIALAFKLPAEEVFRAAKKLPPEPLIISEKQRQLIELAAQSDEKTLDLAIAILRADLNRLEREKKSPRK